MDFYHNNTKFPKNMRHGRRLIFGLPNWYYLDIVMATSYSINMRLYETRSTDDACIYSLNNILQQDVINKLCLVGQRVPRYRG